MTKYELRQIYYDEETFSNIVEPFIPLDNSNTGNEWYEFLPILKFLNNEELTDDLFYGFLSPKFVQKSGVCIEQLLETIEANKDFDVLLFSPFWDQLAYFSNVFEQGEQCHPGLFRETLKFLNFSSVDINLNEFITSSEDSCFSNYVVAKKPFWLEWKKLAHEFFNYSELAERNLRKTQVRHRGQEVALKVFIQERLNSIILASNKFRCKSIERHSITSRLFEDTPENLKLLKECDYYKQSYRKIGRKPFWLEWRKRANQARMLQGYIEARNGVSLNRKTKMGRKLRRSAPDRR